MDFRFVTASVSLLLLSFCSNTDKVTAAISNREKCQCVEETNSVRWRKVTDFTIIQKDSFCNKIQIILQLSNKQSCLNPDSKPGKRLQQCWRRIKFNPQKKKICLTLKSKTGPKKRIKH
ncbi:chemokine (C-X-C motif) ligand 18a, duplicate 1 [Paramisgurnus dabryanus]|uniref:chemokine (C-X-C motif) ligand 18a, duplicate 1 n=1 Tax=Paramisgurnus dabryanus TaxID=90735 RepID=UPI0031F34AE0